MNTKKHALYIITGLGSVLCQAHTKEVAIPTNQKIAVIHEHKDIPVLKNNIVIPEKKKEIVSMPVKKELDKPLRDVEKQVSVKPKQETTVAQASSVKTKDMLTYKKHWTGHYTPSKFILMMNGQEIKQDTTTDIALTDGVLNASYEFEFTVFGKVQRAGKRVFEFKIPEAVENIASTFSWDEPKNLVLNKGALVASKDVSY
jgi:hypothetical protein